MTVCPVFSPEPDQTRVNRAHRGLGQAQLLQSAGAEIFHHHIGARDQAAHGGKPVGRLQVHRDRALVAPGRHVIDAGFIHETVADGPVALERPSQRLDRDDIRADVAKELRRGRS